jgi:hypothetical protein
MIDYAKLEQTRLNSVPFMWAAPEVPLTAVDVAALADSYPQDHFKEIDGYDDEKVYKCRQRSLVHMGARQLSYPGGLSPAWRRFAADLLSPRYRAAMGKLIGRDLGAALLEVNFIEYGPGACLGPHLDFPEKILNHIFYFNPAWSQEEAGTLRILRSRDAGDVADEVVPVLGRSALIVRAEHSWHTVMPVAADCTRTRRCLNVIFNHPGTLSCIWRPHEEQETAAASTAPTGLAALRNRLFGAV